MSDLLQIGRSGVTAYRTALAVVGDNVANAQTAGYVRRDARLEESAIAAGHNPVYRDRSTFGGVLATGVTRAWDAFKAADARLATGTAARAETRLKWLSAAEGQLGDNATDVGAQVTAFFNAADTLAADPGSTGARRGLLLALDGAAGTIRQTAAGLKSVSDGIADEARNTADGLNADLKSLEALNLDLRRTPAGGTARAQLEDERDRLVEQVSARVDVSAAYADDGTVTLTVPSAGNVRLAAPGYSNRLLVDQAEDGRLTYNVDIEGAPRPIAPAGGSLAGLAAAAQVTADQRGALDALATDFAAALNGWSASGTDANGAAGQPLLALGTGKALTLSIAIDDPALVPAGRTGEAANANLLQLSPLRGTGGAEASWATLATAQAQLVSAATAESSAAGARRDGANSALDSITGVDLDREAADLIRYQQAYDASARIIQVARDTMQSILNLF